MNRGLDDDTLREVVAVIEKMGAKASRFERAPNEKREARAQAEGGTDAISTHRWDMRAHGLPKRKSVAV